MAMRVALAHRHHGHVWLDEDGGEVVCLCGDKGLV